MIKQIKKRNGQLVDFDANKLNKWATWASDINGVEWASVALDAVKNAMIDALLLSFRRQ